MLNPQITAAAGWSEAVEERAKRLLAFPMGTEDGQPVTMADLLRRVQRDPVACARFLMVVPPLVAQHELIEMVAAFRIDGQPCPDPVTVALAALSFAGRAVSLQDIHPERRWLTSLFRVLFGGWHRPR